MVGGGLQRPSDCPLPVAGLLARALLPCYCQVAVVPFPDGCGYAHLDRLRFPAHSLGAALLSSPVSRAHFLPDTRLRRVVALLANGFAHHF